MLFPRMTTGTPRSASWAEKGRPRSTFRLRIWKNSGSTPEILTFSTFRPLSPSSWDRRLRSPHRPEREWSILPGSVGVFELENVVVRSPAIGTVLHSVLIWTEGARLTVMVLRPKIWLAKSSLMYRSIPSTTLTTTRRNMTPIMTPRREKKLFSFSVLI